MLGSVLWRLARAAAVLSGLKGRIVPGTMIVFDEYFNYPGWEQHEFRAFQEFVATTGLRYRYLGFASREQAVAVKIVGEAAGPLGSGGAA